MNARRHTGMGVWLSTLALGIAGCMGSLGPDGETMLEPTPDPDTWALDVESEGSDRYLMLDQANAMIRGTTTATSQPVDVQVGMDPGAMSSVSPSGGAFGASVSVDPGLSLAYVTATDGDGRHRDAHRSILRASYVPEGDPLMDAAALTVDETMLGTLSAAAAGSVSSLDLTSFFMPGSELLNAMGCVIYAGSMSHSPPTLDLAITDAGELRAIARVSDIRVSFYGQCNLLGQSITIRDNSEVDETTAELSMTLNPIPPAAPGECVSGFTSSDVGFELTSFDIDLRLSGCGLLCLAGELVGEIAEGMIKSKLEEQIRDQLDGVIDPQLAMLNLFGEPSQIEFLGTPVEIGLCLTGLGPEMGQLTARLGTRVTGPGGNPHESPGAPALPATADLSTPGAIYLDPALVGQIVYSVWNGGALTIDDISAIAPDAPAFPVSAIGTSPEVRRYLNERNVPAGENLRIAVDAVMPPLVRAATPEEAASGADLFIEIGDLRLVLGSATAGNLFTISTHARLALALEATPTGALAPMVLPDQSTFVSWLSDTEVPELTNRSIDSLLDMVSPLLREQVPNLLSGAEIQLPDLGGPILVADITPTPSGTLEVILASPDTTPPAGP
ncbi:MAG: hypothetical protein AB7S26_32705 [Sandaracinaceae bacterium]